MQVEILESKIKELKNKANEISNVEIKLQLTKEIQKLREEIAEVKAELKLLETPIQQLLPDIFEEKRAIPNSFLRGALFGIVKKGKRAIVKNEKVFTMSQYNLIFSGEYLDQNDLELWDTLIFLSKTKKVDNELRITLYELCKAMRLSPGKLNYDRLINRANRLQFARIEIGLDQQIFLGHLIHNIFIDKANDGKLVVIFDRHISKIFQDNDYTLISVDIRQYLGDNQLARWLYNFYESHNDPIPFTIEYLKKLCRSEADLKEFRRMIKNSLELVKKAHNITGNKTKWDYEITKNEYLMIYKNGRPEKQLILNLF